MGCGPPCWTCFGQVAFPLWIQLPYVLIPICLIHIAFKGGDTTQGGRGDMWFSIIGHCTCSVFVLTQDLILILIGDLLIQSLWFVWFSLCVIYITQNMKTIIFAVYFVCPPLYCWKSCTCVLGILLKVLCLCFGNIVESFVPVFWQYCLCNILKRSCVCFHDWLN